MFTLNDSFSNVGNVLIHNVLYLWHYAHILCIAHIVNGPLMAYSHCTGMEPGQTQGMTSGAMDPNILHGHIAGERHTGQRQGKKPGSIISYCDGPVP